MHPGDKLTIPSRTSSPAFRRLLGPLQLAAVVFFMVSGGPYGLEPLLNQAGAPLALLLVLLVPFVWCVPAQLMVLELNGMMPRYGGYYQWVKNALDFKWGFFEGWWSWIFASVDLAIYPVLFLEYLSYLAPGIAPYKHLVCLAMVWICAAVNLVGIVPTGRSIFMLGIAVIVPFAAVFAFAFTRSQPHPAPASHAFTLPAFGMGLFTVLWNYLGWDNASPLAEEVERPVRSYPFSFVLAFVSIVGLYALSVLAAESAGIDPALLERDGFPLLASHVGGAWLGSFISLGGMASALGIFLSTLLYISRLPKAMADDGLLPVPLGKLHTRTQVPHVSILLCSVVVSALVFWDLTDLLIIDVTLYGAALVLEFISLIVLRVRRPNAMRPFRIPLGTGGLVVLMALPTLCFVAALGTLLTAPGTHEYATLFAAGAVASGPMAWTLVGRKRNGKG